MSAAGDSRAVIPANARPRREDWPDPPPQTEAGAALTEVIMATFRLNGRLMDIAQRLAREGEITATQWQVLGGVLDEPRSVSGIGRRMGMTRQGVQRVADQLVARGLAEYWPNPDHQRAKLLACSQAGYWAIRQITLAQRPWADQIGAQIGDTGLKETRATMQHLIDTLEAEQTAQEPENGG